MKLFQILVCVPEAQPSGTVTVSVLTCLLQIVYRRNGRSFSAFLRALL